MSVRCWAAATSITSTSRAQLQGDPQVERAFRLNPEQLGNYYVGTGRGQLVPLSTFATLKYKVQPQALKHFSS